MDQREVTRVVDSIIKATHPHPQPHTQPHTHHPLGRPHHQGAMQQDRFKPTTSLPSLSISLHFFPPTTYHPSFLSPSLPPSHPPSLSHYIVLFRISSLIHLLYFLSALIVCLFLKAFQNANKLSVQEANEYGDGKISFEEVSCVDVLCLVAVTIFCQVILISWTSFGLFRR